MEILRREGRRMDGNKGRSGLCWSFLVASGPLGGDIFFDGREWTDRGENGKGKGNNWSPIFGTL